MSWNKGEITYICQKCENVIAKEIGEIKDDSSCDLFVICKKCK